MGGSIKFEDDMFSNEKIGKLFIKFILSEAYVLPHSRVNDTVELYDVLFLPELEALNNMKDRPTFIRVESRNRYYIVFYMENADRVAIAVPIYSPLTITNASIVTCHGTNKNLTMVTEHEQVEMVLLSLYQAMASGILESLEI